MTLVPLHNILCNMWRTERLIEVKVLLIILCWFTCPWINSQKLFCMHTLACMHPNYCTQTGKMRCFFILYFQSPVLSWFRNHESTTVVGLNLGGSFPLGFCTPNFTSNHSTVLLITNIVDTYNFIWKKYLV